MGETPEAVATGACSSWDQLEPELGQHFLILVLILHLVLVPRVLHLLHHYYEGSERAFVNDF